MKILMVCLGNICRSPIAEGVLKNIIEKKQMNWVVASAGTENYHSGEPPYHYSQKICQKNGIDISQQRAKPFVASDIDVYDKIYAMSEDVLKTIKDRLGTRFDGTKITLFLNELTPGANKSVPDPWYGTEIDYEIVFDLIERTCEKIVLKYKSEQF